MPRPRGYKARIDEVLIRLEEHYPDVRCALDHKNAFQLLCATILSAQTTDARVNMVTPALFEKYPTPEKLAAADVTDVEEIIRSTGFYRTKAKNLVAMAQSIVANFDGEVPQAREDLVTLPGTGRKTANVVRSVAFDLDGLPVDTHVMRLTKRLKLTNESGPVPIELDLIQSIDPKRQGRFSLQLIEHGRQICVARKPKCDECFLNDICPSAFKV